MKISVFCMLSMTMLCSCSFVDDTQVKISPSIPVSEFINQEISSVNTTGATEISTSDGSGIIFGLTGSESKTVSGAPNTQIISTINKTTKLPTSQPKNNTGAITVDNTNDMTLSGTNLPDPLLKSASDADVSNLINSLFDSTK